MELRKFLIPAPAGEVEGVAHLPPSAPRAIAVVAHPLSTMGGTMENKVVTTLAKTFTELGYVTLRFNFRGVENSSGQYDEGNGEVDDAVAVVRYAFEEFGALPLILAGFSFGGYVQAKAAQQLSPQQLELIAPAVGRFAMPPVPPGTLVVHGDADEVVALQEVINWARPQQLPVLVLPGAVHYFHGRLHQLKAIVSAHFTGHPL